MSLSPVTAPAGGPTPSAGARIDLNAKRAARREARGERLVVVIGDVELALAPELPIDVVEKLAQLAPKDGAPAGDAALADEEALEVLVDAMRGLFGPDGWQTFREAGATLDDLVDLVGELFTLYGVSLGEAQASAASSRTVGASSRPTSRTTTPVSPAATSARSRSARKR